MGRRLAAPPLLLVLCVLLGACGPDRAPSTASLDAGSPDKLASSLRSFEGKPVIVNYWATWCIPCKEEMPRIVAAAERYGERVHFLGVNVEDDTELAAEFAREYEVPFRSLSDQDGAIRRDQKILGLPVTQFYGPDGTLALVHQGEIRADQLKEKIEEVLLL